MNIGTAVSTFTKGSGAQAVGAPIVAEVSADESPVAIDPVSASVTSQCAVAKKLPPLSLSAVHKLVLSSANNRGHIEVREGKNPFAVPIDGKYAEALIHEAASKAGRHLSRQAVSDAKYRLQSNAERIGAVTDIWYRVAPVPGGVEIDLGDKTHARVRISAGKVELVMSGSETVFARSLGMQAMAIPAEVGDIDLLKKYVNLRPALYVLWLAWVTYTMATPKRSHAKFVILVLQGSEGSGKSVLARLTQRLIDPSLAGLRRLPKSEKDFAVAAQSCHVLALDNLRFVNHETADMLCVAATGGAISSRALYTDGEQSVLSLHVAVILNGIPNLVDQPDLAQRTLQLQAQVLPEHLRKTEEAMETELSADLPAIQRGLYDLIAKVFEQLPKVKVTRPARMIDFSRWLAAMELVFGTPEDAYQDAYLYVLKQGQLDGLLDNVLAAEILKFTERQTEGGPWEGTPAEFLEELNKHVGTGTTYSKGWPKNPISLSKRLLPLQTALMSQGVALELDRGKHRRVIIKRTADFRKLDSGDGGD